LKLRWLPAALEEVEAAVEYLERQRPGLGDEFTAILRESLARMQERPESCSLLETLPPELGYRRLIMPRFSYLIVCRQIADQIVIVAVPHASREPNYWLTRDRKPAE
jgi:toxin ParE1/3/4